MGIGQDNPVLPRTLHELYLHPCTHERVWECECESVCVCVCVCAFTFEGPPHSSSRVWMCCGQDKSPPLSLQRLPGGNPGSNCTKHNHMLLFPYTRAQSSHLHRYSLTGTHTHTHTHTHTPQLLSFEKQNPAFHLGDCAHLFLLFHLSWASFISIYWFLFSALPTTPTPDSPVSLQSSAAEHWRCLCAHVGVQETKEQKSCWFRCVYPLSQTDEGCHLCLNNHAFVPNCTPKLVRSLYTFKAIMYNNTLMPNGYITQLGFNLQPVCARSHMHICSERTGKDAAEEIMCFYFSCSCGNVTLFV